MIGTLELTFFSDNSRVSIDVAHSCNEGIGGKPFAHGGQGRIYRCDIEHQGKELDVALKVMPDSIPGTIEVFRRLKGLRNSFVRLGNPRNPTFFGVTHRGLPIAQGSAVPAVFQWPGSTRVLNILAFNFVDGQLLGDYLREEDPLTPKRIRAAKQILEMLIFLQNHGVVHSDLYPDNFIVDKQGRLFALDLEGAGIKTRRGSWDFKPTVRGKPHLWPLPPEAKDGNPNFQSDIWVGVYLIFETLTGFKPLDFMQRMDKEALDDLYQASANSSPTWPPRTSALKFSNPNYTPEEMKEFMDYYFRNTYLHKLLFHTYVSGYKNPTRRPKFSVFKIALTSILERGAHGV